MIDYRARRAPAQPQEHQHRDSANQLVDHRPLRVWEIISAFDTIYAEGQRRYVESPRPTRVNSWGRWRPDVGSSRASLLRSRRSKSTSRNPRSTVAAVTEVYDYLRLLFARIGIPHCPKCGKVIASQTVEQMVDTVLAMPEGTRLLILAPLVRGRKGEYRKELEEIRKEGFARVRIDGEVLEVAEEISLDRYKQHWIDIVVDRIVVRPDARTRLADSFETALKLGKGVAAVAPVGGAPRTEAAPVKAGAAAGLYSPDDIIFSEKFACASCGISFDEIAPRNFSFNNPYGACPACHGLGYYSEFSPDLVIDPARSIKEGGVIPFAHSSSASTRCSLPSPNGVGDAGTPLREWPEESLDALVHGSS